MFLRMLSSVHGGVGLDVFFVWCELVLLECAVMWLWMRREVW